MTQHILVTGGAGFLGSHLCAALLKAGHRVISLDNFYTGAQANLADIADNPQFTSIQGDVTVPFAVPADMEFDAIYNLACPASPVHYQFDPVQTAKTSVLGALNMLELAHKNKCPILQASTSEVYGDPKEHPQREEYVGHVNPIGIRACYDEGKRLAETLFFDYARKHQTQIKVVRIFNTYGPHMHPNDGRVVSNFIVQALSDAPITIYGDGKQTRSFCYVDDLISGITKMMDSDMSVFGPVNLGNPHEFTMLELAEKVIYYTKSKSKIVHLPLPADDPAKRRPDISKAKTQLNWEPTVTLDDGLQRTIAYFERLQKEGADFARYAKKVANG